MVNDARVLPWKMGGRTSRGRTVEVYLMRGLDGAGCFEGYLKTRRPDPAGEDLVLEAGRLHARATRLGEGPRWTIRFEEGAATPAILEQVGRAPLPPYIHRAVEHDPHREEDRRRYQTVFAREACAVAAPTAGLHLSPELLAALEARGVEQTQVTLAVGPGTFLPLPEGPLEDWAPEPEVYAVGEGAAAAVERTRARGGRVVAVGTTTCRALETAARDAAGRAPVPGPPGRVAPHRTPRGHGPSPPALAPASGTTNLFLRPGDQFHAVDMLLTNFHLPRTSLLALVAAFAGTHRVRDAYEEAVREGYRFFSYGDAMLCERAEEGS